MHTIRTRVAFICFSFSLSIILLFFTVLWGIFSYNQKNTVLQSSRFNLELTAHTIDERLTAIANLRSWCTGASSLLSYFKSAEVSSYYTLSSYYRLLEQFNSTPYKSYISKLILTDFENRLLQTGSYRFGSDIPSTIEGLSQWLTANGIEDFSSGMFWDSSPEDLQTDRLILYSEILISSARKGICYIELNPELLLEPLENYAMATGSVLLLHTPRQDFQFCFSDEGISLRPIAFDTPLQRQHILPATDVPVWKDTSGQKFALIQHPLSLSDDWVLTQAIPLDAFSPFNDSYFLLVFCVSCLILLASFALVLYLDHTINRPAQRLCNRISAIAGGNFTPDPDIEWNNELGVIGRGINKMSHDINELLDVRVKNEKEKQELEYRVLQNQIDPHFIYNTLNTIKWMATFQKAYGIAEITTAFAHLLKSVSKGNQEMIPLYSELALLNDYCLILKYRYGGGIKMDVAEISDESLCRCLIPRFSLQPLAENAVIHGLEPKGGTGNIQIRIYRVSARDFCIEVEDDGIGIPPETLQHILQPPVNGNKTEKFRKIGIRNIHQRLQYTFGPEYGLTLESEPLQYTKVTLHIPCITNPEGETTC